MDTQLLSTPGAEHCVPCRQGSGRVLLFTVPGVRTRCSLLRAAHRGPGRAGPKTHGWRVRKPRFRLRPNRLETLGSLRWHKWFSH